MIDLHSHSTASDGVFSPSELVNYANKEGITVLALTDHDTIDGLAEAQKTALKTGITFVPGIEIQIQWPTGEFHLLGLSLKSISPTLVKIINLLQKGRKDRNLEIINRMNQAGMDITLEEVSKKYNVSTIGRPHIAAWMVDHGVVKKRQLAFDKYLAKGRPFYVERVGASLDEAIVAIKESGGIPVIAHPLSLYVSWGKIEPILKDIHDRGVEGLEAWHPGARVVECERLEKMAHKLGFFVTGGSDFHGQSVRTDRFLGKTAGNRTIDDRFWLEELQPALQKKETTLNCKEL
ncbi:MAG: phosphatase [Treponema sp. CETP13]|nr:MAG: phosphatase [Treponema sp. CETP13]